MAVALVSVLALGSCQKVPLLAPSGSTLTLVPAANVLPVNGSVGITAVILEGSEATGTGGATTTTAGVGQPVHDGTEVTFTTSLGTIQPATAKTENGQVTVRLVGDGRSGVAKITAFSGAATANVSVNVGAAAATAIAMTANPQTLPSTGGTSTITATVADAQGNGLLGVPITFSTDTGTLGATSGLTDSGGHATTTLTLSGVTANQTATVTAGSGGATAAITGTVKVNLSPRTTITVATSTTSGLVVSAPVTFTITVGSSPSTASTSVSNLAIDFGDGEVDQLGSSATGAVHLYSGSGVFTVTASATDASGAKISGSTQVAVGPLQASATASATGAGTDAATFTVTTSAGAFIAQYNWDFGDGNTLSTASNTVSHIYGSSGPKTAVVTVVPQAGSPIQVPISVVVS